MPAEEPIVFEAPEVTSSGKRLTVAEQAARNMEIVGARGRGLSVAQVARTYGIGDRRVKQIVAEFRRQNPSIRHQEPVDIVDDLLGYWTGAIEELAVLSATAKQDAVRVGAINSRMGAISKMTELLQAINALPNDLGVLRIEMDARVLADRLIVVIEKFGLPEEVEDAMLDALRPGEHKVLEGTVSS